MGDTAISSPRGRALQRSLAITFEAIKEHAKMEPAEAAAPYEAIAAHLRSAAPQALRGAL